VIQYVCVLISAKNMGIARWRSICDGVLRWDFFGNQDTVVLRSHGGCTIFFSVANIERRIPDRVVV